MTSAIEVRRRFEALKSADHGAFSLVLSEFSSAMTSSSHRPSCTACLVRSWRSAASASERRFLDMSQRGESVQGC